MKTFTKSVMMLALVVTPALKKPKPTRSPLPRLPIRSLPPKLLLLPLPPLLLPIRPLPLPTRLLPLNNRGRFRTLTDKK